MDTDQTPLEGTALLEGVRDILVRNPERHDQATWIDNAYNRGVEIKIPVSEIRVFMYDPVPEVPAVDAAFPPCGTVGCAFGWGAILAAPPGSYITNGRIYLPGGDSFYLPDWVGPRMGFTERDASFVFSPARTREQLIAILDARIADPQADIRAVVNSRSYLGE